MSSLGKANSFFPAVTSCLYFLSWNGVSWKCPPFMLTHRLILSLFWTFYVGLSRRECFTADFLVFLLFQFLYSAFCMFPEAYTQELLYRCVHWDWAPYDLLSSTIMLSCGFLWSFPFAIEEAVLKRVLGTPCRDTYIGMVALTQRAWARLSLRDNDVIETYTYFCVCMGRFVLGKNIWGLKLHSCIAFKHLAHHNIGWHLLFSVKENSHKRFLIDKLAFYKFCHLSKYEPIIYTNITVLTERNFLGVGLMLCNLFLGYRLIQCLSQMLYNWFKVWMVSAGATAL